ncbi:MAG: 16S rRNA (guanine(966)-N(2))-methyltransferase RsmD [Gammaproteobacteria bacterium]|nr:16S rRNA (guanine(966)-N(2))-methyltransferase RsmD [Gammaproteobacteria bacterium]
MAHLPNTLRIIGGSWRGRKLHFPDVDGLRPTPDRVRETLFNWLQPVIAGAHCLDLFAGSGALGFEALSRGAASVVMVERDGHAVQQLRENITILKTSAAQVIQCDALEFLINSRADVTPFDVVFLDPPYYQNLINPCCTALESGGWLSANSILYIEAELALQTFALPRGFEHTRNKRAGQVGYHLAVRQQSR